MKEEIKSVKRNILLSVLLALSTRFGYSENPTKAKEGYNEENISKLNPKIVLTSDGKTIGIVLSVNDSLAKITQECFEWHILSHPAVSKVADLDNQQSNCETNPVNLYGQSASINLVDKAEMLVKRNIDSFYLDKVTSTKLPVVYLEGIQYGSYQPYSYISISKSSVKLTIEFSAKQGCLRYELTEKTDECKGSPLPIQWVGSVRKEIELEINENKLGIKR